MNPVAVGIAEVPAASAQTAINECVGHVKIHGRTGDPKAARKRSREVAERLGVRRVPNPGGCPAP